MGRLSKYDEVLQKGNLEVVEVHYYHRLVQVVVRELIGTRMYSIKTDRRKGAGLCAILYTICSFNTKFSTSTLLRAHFLVLYLNRHPRKDACSADTQSNINKFLAAWGWGPTSLPGNEARHTCVIASYCEAEVRSSSVSVVM